MTGDAARGPLFSLESQLLDWVQAAVIVTDLNGEVVFANPFCEVLYGRGPDELIGVDAKCFAIDPLAPDLLADIGREILNGRTWEGEFRVERADGTAVQVHAVDSPVFDEAGTVAGVVSLAFDVTAARLTQQEMQRILAVAQILRDIGETLVSELDATRVMKTVTGAARKLTGAAMAAFLVNDPDDAEGGFVVAAMSGRARADTVGVALPGDAPLLGRALVSDGPTRFDDLIAEPGYERGLEVILRAPTPPLRSCVVMPVRSRAGDVVGALVVAHPDAGRFGVTEEGLLRDIAAQAGIVLDIARLFRAAEVEIEARRRSEEIQRFYAETSVVLSSSLDYPESFEQLGRLCVPFLADLCLIDVAEEYRVRRLAAVHADPAKRRSSPSSNTTIPPIRWESIRPRASCAGEGRGRRIDVGRVPAGDDARRASLPNREGSRLHVVHVRPDRGARPNVGSAHAGVVGLGPAIR